MGLVVSFAGQIGSGKSSVSRSLATILGWRRATFGDYLRKRAAKLRLDSENRQVLQDLGQSLVDRDSVSFCQAVLLDAGYTQGSHLLVDGVRHVEIQHDIAAIVAPSASRLIYLRAGQSERLSRVQVRADGRSDFGRAEEHVVESELRRGLPDVADAIIDAEQELAVVVEKCARQISAWLDAMPFEAR